jgi:hypothetical protein
MIPFILAAVGGYLIGDSVKSDATKMADGGVMDVKKCQRCHNDTHGVTTMSMFNEDIICMDCKEQEKKHPDYEKAVNSDIEEIKKGNYNFKGIGYKYANGGLIAPNGKKSNLTPEQYKLVRTPEFKAWFGDWENDAANASKVVDEETKEPLVVYHGSYYNFNIFPTKNDSHFFTDTLGLAKHFSEWEDDDGKYHKGKIYEVFLNLKNPKSDLDEAHGIYEGLVYKYENGEIEANIVSESSEGAILFYENWYSFKVYENVTNYVVFNSNQIKLADGTNTTFDGSNPDIRYADGGNTSESEIDIDSILDEEDNIKVYYVKGDIGFDGRLRKYHSGRANEYEFEPSYFNDEESEAYYDENWESIEEEILNKFYLQQTKQKK